MANTSGKATIRQASYPTYRPLDRSKGEFRLLKILPSVNRLEADAEPLDFSQDPVRCQLQYESLDVLAASSSTLEYSKNSIAAYIFQDLRRTRANDAETDVGALVGSLESQFSRMLSVDRNTTYEISTERMQVLQELYETSRQKLEVWRPEGIQLDPKSFKEWLSSWVWTPLSGDTNHLEEKSLGYFALSYVWRDQGQVTYGTDDPEIRRMVAASGLTMRQALERTSMAPQAIEELCNQEGGSTDDSAEIVLDGVPLLVGRNLEKALRTLREMPEIPNGTRVWVDALCINQQDVQEKNFEVKRMGDIYRKADRVVSYLGEESDQSGSILEFMDAIGEVMQQARVLAPITLGFLQNVQADMAFSMARFLMRTYFSRIWIVQEIVLGGDKSIVICGARRFSWTNLLRCGKMLSAGMAASASWNFDMQLGWIQNKEEEPYCVTLADLRDGITKLQMLRDARIDSRGEKGENNQVARRVPHSSTLWFRIASSNNATDSRDRIYGMMDLLPKKLTDFINVDYASPNQFVDVMRMFAEAHIKSTQSLHWILHRSYSPFLGHQDWPTWVPNMAQRFSSAHWDWTVNLDGNACPDIPCTPSFSIASDTGKHLLVCKGMKLDMILNATQNVVTDSLREKMSIIHHLTGSMSSENAEAIHPILQALLSSVHKQQWLIVKESDNEATTDSYNPITPPIASAKRYENTEGLKAALNKCFSRFGVKLAGGQSIFNFPLDISEEDKVPLKQFQASREFDAPKWAFNIIRDFFADFYLWGPTFRDLFPAHAANVDPASFSVPEIEGLPMSVARLFTTFGGYVGACLCNVRAGDELFLLAGCSMPVLLKRSAVVAGAYELRGGVYVPGLMAGEAFYGMERPRDHFKTLLIC